MGRTPLPYAEPQDVAPALAQELARRGYRAFWACTGSRRYAVAPEDPDRRLSRPELIAAVQEAAQAVGFPKAPVKHSAYWQAVATAVKDWLPECEPEDPTAGREAARLRMRRVRARYAQEAREAAREAMPRYLAALPGPMSGADAWRYWRDSWSWSDPAGDALAWLTRKEWLRMLRESGHATGEGRKLRVDPRPEAAGAAETA